MAEPGILERVKAKLLEEPEYAAVPMSAAEQDRARRISESFKRKPKQAPAAVPAADETPESKAEAFVRSFGSVR